MNIKVLKLKKDTELTDEELQESIDHSLGHLAEMVVKEDGAVENGNTVNIDFSGSVDGEDLKAVKLKAMT